ncbi:MAG: BON domain-containing protein [Ginsengibacter sp.]
MKDYNWNPYPKDWHKSDQYKNSDWNFDPRDQSYYLGKVNNYENTDLEKRYYTDGSDRYYSNEEIKRHEGLQAHKNQIKDTDPYKNNDFYGHRSRNYSWGPHRGKGPKNYIRSADRIKEDASDILFNDTLVDASNIDVEVKDNELVLSGTVETRLEKRRAELLLENVSGIKHLQNNLRVSDNSGNNENMFG